ncbi:MAG: choice-of-anchor D domain-containing protein, partial [Candidatus Binatus sp.]
MAQSADNTPAKAQAPKLVLSPDKVLPFGKIIAGLTGGPLTVTATNPSTSESIAIDNVTVSAPFAISSNNCGTSIAPSSSCEIGVTFSPKKKKDYEGRLEVKYDLDKKAAVKLLGKGVHGATPTPTATATPTQTATATATATVTATATAT